MKASELIEKIKEYPDLDVRVTTDVCILEDIWEINILPPNDYGRNEYIIELNTE